MIPDASPASPDGSAPSEPIATTGATVAVGGAWHVVSQLVPQLYTVVTSVVAARVLGPTGMGKQSFIAFVAISVVSMASAGLNVALLRYVGELAGRGEGDVLRSLLRWAWRIEAALAVVGATVLLAVGFGRGELEEAWALAAIVVIAGVLHSVPSSMLYGLQRWREASIVGLVTGAVSTVATITVLALGGGIVGMFAVEAVAGAVNLVWTSTLARRSLRGSGALAVDPTVTRAVRGYALIVSVDVLLTYVVWRRSEFFFLERYSSDAQIALYSVAFAAVNVLGRIPDALGMVLAPAVANLLGAGQLDRVRVGYGRAVRLLVQLMLPMTAGAMAVGPAVLRLVYGREYADSGPVVVVLLATFLAVPVFNLTSGLLTGLGHARVLLVSVAVAAVVNVALDVSLIPRHDAVGAALANGSAQLTAALLIVLYVRARIGGVRWGMSAVARTAVAAAAAGGAALAAVRALGDLAGLPVAVVAGAATFLLLAVAMRILAAPDHEWLQDNLVPRLPARAGALAGRLLQRVAAA